MKTIGCPICSNTLEVRIARGRKSNKPFIMFICPEDGRHFRGFISHRPYVKQVLDSLEEEGRSFGQLQIMLREAGAGAPWRGVG